MDKLRRQSQFPGGAQENAFNKFRRMSRLASVAFSVGRRMSSMGRPSISSRTSMGQGHINLVKLEPTYRLEPHKEEKFNPTKVSKVINETLERFLEGEVYNPTLCSQMSQQLSESIRNKVKEIGFPRYKLVCKVIIGQKADQGVEMSSRCLWNDAFDTYASGQYENKDLFAIAVIYAVYFE